MRAGNNQKRYMYYICDVSTDLPRYIADTFDECCDWIGCSSRTLAYMIKYGTEYNGFAVYKLRDF